MTTNLKTEVISFSPISVDGISVSIFINKRFIYNLC